MSESFARAHRNNLRPRAGAAQPGRRRPVRPPGRRLRRGVRQLQAGHAARTRLLLRAAAGAQPRRGARREQRIRRRRAVEQAHGLRTAGARHDRRHPPVDLRSGGGRIGPPPVLRRDDDLPRPCGGPDHRDRRAGRTDPAASAPAWVPASTSRRPRPPSISSTPSTSPRLPRSPGSGDVVEDSAVHRVLAVRRRGRMVRGVPAFGGTTVAPWRRWSAVTSMPSWPPGRANRSPVEVTAALQAVGVPVGPMNRADDVQQIRSWGCEKCSARWHIRCSTSRWSPRQARRPIATSRRPRITPHRFPAPTPAASAATCWDCPMARSIT